MGDDKIIRSVVQRFRTMTAAKTNWFNEAWVTDIEDAKQGVSDDTLKIQESSKPFHEISKVFRSLAGPLKAPKISDLADRVDGIVESLEEFSKLSRECVALMDDLDRDWEALMSKVAKGEKPKDEALKEVKGLSTYKRYLTIAEKAGAIQDEVTKIFDGYDMDWTLENYVGAEAGIYDDLEKLSPSNPFDDLTGTVNLFGVLVLYTEEEVLENWLEDSKS